MTDWQPQRGLPIYLQRLKIEQTFRDLKSLLHLDKLMNAVSRPSLGAARDCAPHRLNKQQTAMEQVIALVLLAFTLGTLSGEQFKAAWCAESPQAKRAAVRRGTRARTTAAQRKRKRYSGLFILLKLKLDWSAARLKYLVRHAFQQFTSLLFPPVRTFV